MKKWFSILLIYTLSGLLSGQVINNFDVLPDTTYWGYEISASADSTLSFINVSYITDPVIEGEGAMQLDYGAHNSESWGGYAKIFHYSAPQDDGGGDDTTVVEALELEGTSWVIAPEVGALKVGPGIDDGTWWQNSTEDVTVRACFFDDEYVFNSDGSFNNVLGEETWVETWQGVDSDGCGTPVYPHDGSNAATWDYSEDAGTITLNGVGAFLGIPKAFNGGECSAPEDAPESITYEVYSYDGNALTVMVNIGSGYWTYKMVPAESTTNSIANDNLTNKDIFSIFEMRPRDGHVWDWSSYDSLSFSYYNSVPASEANRIHLRLNLSDYSGVPEGYSGLGEYYYSFHYILDNEPGWQTITLPLVRNDSWDGAGFNLTGWAGDTDDGELDTDAIGGFHLEFSVSGGGEGDEVHGTVILDNLTLTGYQGVDLIIFNGMSTPSAWGSPFSWGGAQMYVTEGGGYNEETNALTYIQEEQWSGGGFNMTPAVDFSSGNEWGSDSIMFWMHSEADAPTLRLQFEDGVDKVGLNFTPEAAGGWNHYKFSLADFVYFDGSTTFDTSAVTVFQVLSEGNGASGRTFHFDDMWTGNPDFDVIAPDSPENVGGVPAAYFNLVTWNDVTGESDELYNVYASQSEISDIDDSGVELVASNVLEGAQAATHYLYNPLVDASVSYYYAVVCVDAAGNESELGLSSSSLTNTAMGIPTISLDVPSNFAADGDISEWLDSGIMPFEINPTTGHVWNTVDNEDDLNATVYLAIDDEFLYFAADVIDDSYYFGDGDWWDQDALQLFFGLYDWRGPKHVSLMRGEEPDYIVYANETTLHLDNPGGTSIGSPDDAHFYFEGFNPDYVTEGKISLDTLALFGEDERFYPENGMRIPLDIYFHDNDNGAWEGNLGFSHLANDQQWNNPREWAYTWIGDQSTIAGVDDDNNIIGNDFALYPNYPNPFNPVTSIKFSLPKDQSVSLRVYNLAGQMIHTLVDGKRIAGNHSVQWNAATVASGVYFYRLDTGDKSMTQKMILVK